MEHYIHYYTNAINLDSFCNATHFFMSCTNVHIKLFTLMIINRNRFIWICIRIILLKWEWEDIHTERSRRQQSEPLFSHNFKIVIPLVTKYNSFNKPTCLTSQCIETIKIPHNYKTDKKPLQKPNTSGTCFNY